MKRFANQIEICRLIRLLDKDHDVISFIKQFTHELGINQFQQLLVELFLQKKSLLRDESNEKLLMRLRDAQTQPQNKPKSQLELLPLDIFCNIGSFLPIKDCANSLSRCNHNIHKLVLSEQFIRCLFKIQSKYHSPKLILQPNTIQAMIHNNSCSSLIWLYRNRLILSNNGNTVKCSLENPCAFCNMVGINRSCYNNDNDNYNYDLKWFPMLLSNTNEYIVEPQWKCTCQKIPFEWLLKKNNSKKEEDDRLAILSTNRYLGRSNSAKFSQDYKTYFMDHCDSKMDKVRKISSIDFYGSVDGLTS